MGVQLKVLGVGVGWWGVLDEVRNAIANENEKEERFPFVIVVVRRIEEKLDMIGDMVEEDGVARGRGGWRRG